MLVQLLLELLPVPLLPLLQLPPDVTLDSFLSMDIVMLVHKTPSLVLED